MSNERRQRARIKLMNIHDPRGLRSTGSEGGLFNNSSGTIDSPHKRNDIGSLLHKEHKINSRWIKDFNKKVEL